MKRVLTASLALACVCAGAQAVVERAQSDELVFMGDEEPAMRKAFESARASLDEFLSLARSPAAGTSHHALKVGVREGKKVEYFWVGEFSQTDGGFVGTINNQPRMVKSVAFGQRYNFTRGQIVDWTYIDRNERRMAGNFTLCALLTKESQQEADATKKRYGLRCE